MAVVEKVTMSGALFEKQLKAARIAGLKEALEIAEETDSYDPMCRSDLSDAKRAIRERIASLSPRPTQDDQ